MKQPHPIHRRDFLRLTALGAAGASLGLAGRAAGGPPARRKIPVAVQLYSVREACKQDFPGTLAALARMGYRGVEFAGFWGRSAADIRRMLDDNGLTACGSHTPYEDVQPGRLQATIDFNQALGNRFIIVPNMSGGTRQAWLDLCREFNALAARLQPLGMSIGYHSHLQDFHPVEGEAPWAIFGANTRPEVILQLDTGNCCDGGGDPLAELRRFPGRARSIHVKAWGAGPEAVIGEDKIGWAAIFEFCETRGGTQFYVVEHESSTRPMDTLRRTYAALKALGKV